MYKVIILSMSFQITISQIVFGQSELNQVGEFKQSVTIDCRVKNGEQVIGHLILERDKDEKLAVDDSTWIFGRLKDMGPNSDGNHGYFLNLGVFKKDDDNAKNTGGIYIGGTGLLIEGWWLHVLNLDIGSLHFWCKR